MSEVKYPQLGDREWLVEHYETQRMSVTEARALVGCTDKAFRNALARHEIPLRGHVDQGLSEDEYDEWIEKGGADENHPVGPTEHKAAKRELGYARVDDLLALNRANDPFYCGTPADWRDAEWFAPLWKEHGSLGHIRRLHYWLISRDEVVTRVNGLPYVNDADSIRELIEAAGKARHLGLLDGDDGSPGALDFEDRRNPDPHINVVERETDAIPGIELETFLPVRLPSISAPYSLDVVEFAIPEPDVVGYDYDDADQPVLQEVWIEKSTMNDILRPLSEELGANLVAGSGMQSITNVVRLLRRCEELGKPGHVMYVSDFDNAGDVMPTAVSRQLEYYCWRYFPDVEVKVTHVALTFQQVKDLDLPRKPFEKDDVRTPRFEARYGDEGFAELDALEALHPGVLADLVREAAAPYQDEDLEDRLTTTADVARANAMEVWEERTAEQRAELDKLSVQAREAAEPFRASLTALYEQFEQAIGPVRERAEELRTELEKLAENFDPELPERDEPELYLDDEDPLFDSERDWLDQLDRYKQDRP